MKRFQALLLSNVLLITGTFTAMNLPVKYLGVDTVSAATDTTSGATAASEAPEVAPAPQLNVSAVTETFVEAGQTYYTVVVGDNLTKIGKKYGVTYQEIAKANKISNPNRIYPGQVLIIPGVKVDVVSGATPRESSDPKALVKGMSADGYWIFSILSDVTVNGDINVDGLFYDKDDTTSKVYRKLALYAQDEAHNVTAEYTLTVKNIYVTSPNFRIQNGKVVGDIHVDADGFELRGATVEGNLYFATQAQMDSAKLDQGTVTGSIGLKAASEEVDAVSGATPRESSDPKALVKGMSADGYWIFSILSDVTVDGDINVDGLFYDKDDTTGKVYRKLALYAQDAAHNVTAEYTLTVKNIYVTSPNFRIQNGKVVGDIHVDADGFELRGATVEGNVYFATQAQMDSAKLDQGTVTGSIGLKAASEEVDAVSGATPRESSDPKALVKGMSADGYWIFSILSDVTVDGDINVDGLFYDKDDTTGKVYRKLALYAQDAAHNVTAEYTLTVKNIYVTSPNFRIQNGKVVGDINVDAEGFELRGATVEGNVYFATQAQMDSAKLDEGTVTGSIGLKAASEEADAVSGATPRESSDPKALVKGMSADGYWIFSILSDVAVDGDINVDGLFYDKDDTTSKVYRKLALYAQDAAHNVTEEYTLTVKNIYVTSPNFRIQNGKVVGDINVDAEGFELRGATVEGNVYFATQAQMDSAKLDEGTVTGEITVK